MAILAAVILTTWSLVALIAGLILGALIRKAERVNQDEFLSTLFSNLEAFQASRLL
ncbi:MAG: hypothetical protein ABSA96_14425 [Candidatus Acidiferrales bacterium]|jgi:hypothetical protein